MWSKKKGVGKKKQMEKVTTNNEKTRQKRDLLDLAEILLVLVRIIWAPMILQ